VAPIEGELLIRTAVTREELRAGTHPGAHTVNVETESADACHGISHRARRNVPALIVRPVARDESYGSMLGGVAGIHAECGIRSEVNH
jgi:hypothetical protein